jgi:hypothetical protein
MIASPSIDKISPTFLRHLVLFGFLGGTILILHATSNQPNGTSSSTVDDRWRHLQRFEHTPPSVPAGSDISSSAATLSSLSTTETATAAGYIQRADELVDFYTKNPTHVGVQEARRLEALMLLYARFNGDNSTNSRCDAAVEEVRRDMSLPTEERYAIALLRDYQGAALQAFDSEEHRRAEFESILRALLQEFPNIPGPYKALLNLAQDCAEGQGTRIASDLLKMNAPQDVKVAAQTLVERNALVGQPLAKLLSATLAADKIPAISQNHITILYAWASWNECALITARQIADKAPTGATIIGVNFDQDSSTARKVAKDCALPGVQLYDAAGLDGKLARKLKLMGESVVMVTSRNGLISTVSGRIDLAAKILNADTK